MNFLIPRRKVLAIGTVFCVSNLLLLFTFYGNYLLVSKSVNKTQHTSNITMITVNNMKNPDVRSPHFFEINSSELRLSRKDVWTSGSSSVIKICLGGGLTSKKISGITPKNMYKKLHVFKSLLLTFCRTATIVGFEYHFYFGIDYDDPIYTNPELVEAFQKTFKDTITKLCGKIKVNPKAQLVYCNYTGRPSWSFNDAFYQGYLDGMDYFYHVNDDTSFRSADWTKKLVNQLQNLEPPNVGVVSPHHSGGRISVMTYHMVHRKHWEIFGYYYPRIFSTWYSDTWLTHIYPLQNAIKLRDVRLLHTIVLEKRYDVNFTDKDFLNSTLYEGKEILKRYLTSPLKKTNQTHNVISMSLHNPEPCYTFGAIRNAQLAPVIYPGWTLRIYVANSSWIPEKYVVNSHVIDTLIELGTQVIYVENTDIPPKYWKYLVADDTTFDNFIIRDVGARLSTREADAVRDWLKYGSGVHCMRDHPSHASLAVVDGLWGANRKMFINALNSDITRILVNTKHTTDNVLQNFIWKYIQRFSYCHDSVTCLKWTNSHNFPSSTVKTQFVGQKFDDHEEYATYYEAPIDDNFRIKCSDPST